MHLALCDELHTHSRDADWLSDQLGLTECSGSDAVPILSPRGFGCSLDPSCCHVNEPERTCRRARRSGPADVTCGRAKHLLHALLIS